MLSQGKKNMGVKTTEEEEIKIASAESQSSYGQLSQIYLEQWEKRI